MKTFTFTQTPEEIQTLLNEVPNKLIELSVVKNETRLELQADSFYNAYDKKVGDSFAPSVNSLEGVYSLKKKVAASEYYRIKGKGNKYSQRGYIVVDNNNIITRIIDANEYDVVIVIEPNEKTLYCNLIQYDGNTDGVWYIGKSLKSEVADALYRKVIISPKLKDKIQYDGQSFIDTTTSDRIVAYLLMNQDTKVRIDGNLTNATKPVFGGVLTQEPTSGIALEEQQEIATEGAFSIFIYVPKGHYFAFAYNRSYTRDISYHTLEGVSFSDMEDIKARCAIYDDRILDVEYSALDEYPNTIYFFESAYAKGFRAFKADLRITSDNGIVLCHDSGYTLDTSGRIQTFDGNNYTPIRDMTLSDVLSLEFSQQTNGAYIHPSTLDDFLVFCKKNCCIPYITIRNEYVEDTIEALYVSLLKYKMEQKVIINLFPANTSIVSSLLTKQRTWLICDTKGTSVALNQEQIDASANLGCTYLCLYKDNKDSITEDLIIYASNKNLRIWLWGSTLNDEDIMLGITGQQNYTKTPFFVE